MGSPYLVDLTAAVGEISRLRWTPAQLITLADDAPTVTDEQLRARLLAFADMTKLVSPSRPA